MNSIDAKGYRFLQQNLPGNDGYGQDGFIGDTGNSGNSVYFTPFILNTTEGMNKCVEYILDKKELSDNPLYEGKAVEYKINDIILDKLGNVYILKAYTEYTDNTTERVLPFSIEYLNNVFTQGSITGSYLQCVLNISPEETSEYYYKKKYNDSFIGGYNIYTGSPYIYHRDRYVSRICGAWLCFNIPLPDQDYHNYIYKYVLLLPNGQRVENITNTSSFEMFVDCRYFYGCFFDNADNLRDLAAYHSINNTQEYSYEFVYALIMTGINKCKAYVEITNADTHNIYRIYTDGIVTNEQE